MKKNICILLILISYVSCSNGQNKEKSDKKIDYAKEILGCWTLFDAYHEIKSNYPEIDSFSLENQRLYVVSAIKESYITKFIEGDIVQFYSLDGKQYEKDRYYEIERDSFSIEDRNSVRTDTKSTSKISISNDTLYLETDILGEVKTDVGNFVLSHKADLKILKDIKIEVAKRYVIFVRVQDCDQYKE